MQYDFDEMVERRGSASYKWDSAADRRVLPLWVADMDFRTAPVVTRALQERAAHGIFGYTRVPQEYYDAVCGWFARRHGWPIERQHIIYTTGVVPGISAVIKALTRPGDGVLLHTPVYNCFFSSIRNNGCQMVSSPLRYDGGGYTIDFDDLERKAALPHVKLMLLCNPHNPAGRVWRREELMRTGEICRRHGVTVVADEIHCELVMPPHRYLPFASLCDSFRRSCVSLVSPSKSFNIAGLQIANVVCADAEMRRRIDRAINDNEVCDVNPFGVAATIAAYSPQGEEWLAQLNAYIGENHRHMQRFCAQRLPQLPLTRIEGTYLEWMDCRALQMSSDAIEEELLAQAQLWLNSGTLYGAEGEGFVRWNIACPRARLTEALQRFARYAEEKLKTIKKL